jgi:putative methyltransferase (TIGR04325 family)
MDWKAFVPPILLSVGRKPQHHATAAPWYPSYAAALAACQGGYEEAQLIRTVYEKTRISRDILAAHTPPVCDRSALRTLVGLSLAVTKRDVHVLDFGGACGLHYFIARAFLGDRVRFQWHVVETPSMAAAAKDFEDGSLRFFESVPRATEALETVDLVFSSGALQYVPDPYATLRALTQCGAQALFLTRLGLTHQPAALITIQTSTLRTNGPGALPAGMPDGPVRYPVVFPSKETVEDILTHQYSLEICFEEETRAYVAGNMGIDMYGYFATRRQGAPAPPRGTDGR